MSAASVTVSEKVCKRCGGAPQPAANFYRHGSSKDGLQSYCKTCDAGRSAARHAAESLETKPDHGRRRTPVCKLCFGLARAGQGSCVRRMRAARRGAAVSGVVRRAYKPRVLAIRRLRNGLREKLCGTCTWRPESAFHANQGRCKQCQAEDHRTRRARVKDAMVPL